MHLSDLLDVMIQSIYLAFVICKMASMLLRRGNDEVDASQHSHDDHESMSQSDSSSSKIMSTSFKGPSKTTDERARDEKKQQETLRVHLVRFICLVVFFSSAVAASVIMFQFTKGNEQNIFEFEVSCAYDTQCPVSIQSRSRHLVYFVSYTRNPPKCSV